MAENSRIALSYKKQTTFGTRATGQYNYMNFDSEELNFDKAKERKNKILPTGERAGLVSKTKIVNGPISTMLQFSNVDTFLASLLRSSWSDVIGGTGGGTITAGATASNLDFVFNEETGAGVGGIITLGSSVSHSILKDQIIYINAADEANTGSFIVIDVSGNDIQVNTPLTDATYQTGATIKGDILRNANTIEFYTFQREYQDIGEFIAYDDCAVSEGEFTFEPENEVEVNLTLIGSNAETLTETASTGTPIAATTNPEIMVGEDVTGVYFDNELMADCLIAKLDFKVSNDTQARKSIAVFGPCNLRNKPIDVTGNITIMFPDLTEYDKYIDDDVFKLDYLFADSLGNEYAITFSQTEYKTAAVNFTDIEEEVPEEHELTMSTNGIYTIQICRNAA